MNAEINNHWDENSSFRSYRDFVRSYPGKFSLGLTIGRAGLFPYCLPMDKDQIDPEERSFNRAP
jgi:hypothetical protein